MSVTGGSEDMGMWVKLASRLKERRTEKRLKKLQQQIENMDADAPES